MAAMLGRLRRFLETIGDFTGFAFRATWKGIRYPLKPVEILEQAYFIGWQSLPVVLFAGFFAGLSQTLFLENELASYGAKMTIGRVIGVTAIRELGPLVVSLMFIGRVGAAFAAEIGSMMVNNQVEAIQALGQDPERKLASPRIWGMVAVALPVVLLTDLMTIIGGWVITGVSTPMFWYQAKLAVYFRHFSSSLVKPFVFGWMIATVACWYGLRTTGGVRGVGQSVSNTVVTCCIWLFIVNALVGIVMIAWTGI
jgi:phospholipid/cholesterol/gamma-HCH transport system permease protein